MKVRGKRENIHQERHIHLECHPEAMFVMCREDLKDRLRSQKEKMKRVDSSVKFREFPFRFLLNVPHALSLQCKLCCIYG